MAFQFLDGHQKVPHAQTEASLGNWHPPRPSVLQSLDPAAKSWRVLKHRCAQTIPDRKCPAGSSPQQIAAAAAAASFAQQTTGFAGKWGGSPLVKRSETCRFHVEIGTQQNIDKPFTAYTNMLCVDMSINPWRMDAGLQLLDPDLGEGFRAFRVK
jgi:hypothetical protein